MAPFALASPSELELEECLERVGSTGIASLGASHRAMPIVVPVAYERVDDAVHITPLAPLALPGSLDGAVVAVAIDSFRAERPAEPADAWCVRLLGELRRQCPEPNCPQECWLLASPRVQGWRALAPSIAQTLPGERS
jgi:hypothetical protein